MPIDLNNLPNAGDKALQEPQLGAPLLEPSKQPLAFKPIDVSALPDSHASQLAASYKILASQPKPDDQAKINELTQRTGLPESVVQRNQGEAERIATEPDWHALQSTAPKTVAALATNPQLFRLTHDDVEHRSEERRVGKECRTRWSP